MSLEMIESLALGIVALGASTAIVPWLSREHNAARVFMVGVSVGLLLRYLVWRIADTLPEVGWTLDFALGVVFLAAEAASLASLVLSLIFLSRTRKRTSEVEANQGWFADRPPPLVDVFICTYNEEEAILERTIVGSTGLDYPNLRVWVLDDGRRPWVKDLSERLGCGYLARSDNRHAKAGNINNALRYVARLPEAPEFIALLDADFVPMPNFLSRTLPLFRNDSVGVVQTPQHFINADPIQTNLAASQVWPDEQRYFFDVVLAARDAWGTAFCCGTSAVIRFAPLMAIGGFPTESVTEDYLLTLRLKEAGYTTSYLNERLTLGLAPEGLKEYITQRGRWCLGFMQIMRGRSGPFSPTSPLGFIDRLSLLDSFLGWAAVYPAKMLGLVVPSLFLLCGITAVDAGLAELLGYFLPFFVWHTVTMSWISGGRAMVIMSDVAQLVAAPTVLRAVLTGLLRPHGHKFKVTAKGGDRSRSFVQWQLLRIYSGLLFLTLAGILSAFVLNVSGEALAFGDLALGWSWYNAFILVIVCFVCVEQPRHRKAERFAADELMELEAAGHKRSYRLVDISITGARLRGSPPAPSGGHLRCTLNDHSVGARVVRVLPGSFAIEFDEAFAARVAMIRSFYSGNYVKAIEEVAAAGVGRAIVARIFG
jgi:cellulose synthase (UDP-forming)